MIPAMPTSPGTGRKRPTIRDVAREAGVSYATVSRVLNGSGPVSEKTRTRVMEAVERFHYHPNELARGLVNGRSRRNARCSPITARCSTT